MSPSGPDLLRWPLVGTLLRWRHVRTAAQLVLLVVAIAIVLHGLLGRQLAATNLATVLTWIHYRGLLIGALLLAGNVFCAACPMILVRDAARRIHAPRRRLPRRLGKWVALALFGAVLFAYELFDLWSLPAATAWIVLGYFGAALAVDMTFAGASFCKHVCPVGQFNFIASTLSPLEVRVRDRDVCRSCTTVDCIKGRRVGSSESRKAGSSEPATSDERAPLVVIQRGCELALFLPSKTGNLDCTFCLDCVHACPHDNAAIGFRVPGDELADDRRRSAIGRLSRRPDLAALALLFTSAALLNAFAMTGSGYDVGRWLSAWLGTEREALVLGLLFAAGLAGVPVALVAAAAAATRGLTPESGLSVGSIAVRFAFALVPFGAGVWLAHYGFHFLTGAGAILPVSQTAAIEATGRALLGDPDWRWMGLRSGSVFPFQLGAVLLGALGSSTLAHRIADRDHHWRAGRAAAPWILLVIALTVIALWILGQPMEMRGTELGG
jgi:ferredoxin